MKNLLYATVAALALVGAAKADVLLDPHLSGTGDNVIFDSVVGNLAIGTFNGQHTGFVDFTDLSGNPAFTGAQNGNDIKISNTNDLQVQVFAADKVTVLPTITQVFSLKGTGDVTAFLFANNSLGQPEAAQVFDLGVINPNAQSGFTFSAVNGEVMTRMVLLDTSGSINDFEHYRIDIAPSVAVPLPAMGSLASPSGLLTMLLGLAFFGIHRWRKQREFGLPLLWAE